MKKNSKELIASDLSKSQISDNRRFTQSFTHNNPNEYNGELIDNQLDNKNILNTKKLFIESYDCQYNNVIY